VSDYSFGDMNISLCRSCKAKLGIIFIADAANEGEDIESLFKEIMENLARIRLQKSQKFLL
jgi:hypothetical protein